MARTARPRFRVNADRWTDLRNLLTAVPNEVLPQEFNRDTDTLRGRRESRPAIGRMSGPALDTFAGYRQAGAIDYVIYSYGTPIAYRVTHYVRHMGACESKWIVPADRYSVTTSKHQGKVRTAISQIGV